MIDYFYHKEHTFIVTELPSDNLLVIDAHSSSDRQRSAARSAAGISTNGIATRAGKPVATQRSA